MNENLKKEKNLFRVLYFKSPYLFKTESNYETLLSLFKTLIFRFGGMILSKSGTWEKSKNEKIPLYNKRDLYPPKVHSCPLEQNLL